MEDLKKAQEEIQAKTSQVKQYKKQHDQLVAKVMNPFTTSVKHFIKTVEGYTCRDESEQGAGILVYKRKCRDMGYACYAACHHPCITCIDLHYL